MNSKRGFTLIELLVVIAIIGLLSSVVFASLNSARMKARDARRIADLGEIRIALELYFYDHGYYPGTNPNPSWNPPCLDDPSWDCNGYRASYDEDSWNKLATDLAPYISPLPKDPINNSCPPWLNNCFSYTYGNVGRFTKRTQYDLTAQFENDDHPRRCGLIGYHYFYEGPSPDYNPKGSVQWCVSFGGLYPDQIYEASLD